MNQHNLAEISLKLVKVIQTRDPVRVRHVARVLDKQKNPMHTVEIFVRVNRHLVKLDPALQQWFHSIYFEDYHPQLKDLWLQFSELCSLSIAENSEAR